MKCGLAILLFLAATATNQRLSLSEKPLSRRELIEFVRLERLGVSNQRPEDLVRECGIEFDVTDNFLEQLRNMDADVALLKAVKSMSKSVAPHHIYNAGEDVTAPVPIERPKPPYTQEARSAKVKGFVAMWVLVDPKGNVADLRQISKPLGKGLDKSVLQTILRWRFKPATHQGIPVPVRMFLGVGVQPP